MLRHDDRASLPPLSTHSPTPLPLNPLPCPAPPTVTIALPDTLALNLPQGQGAVAAHLWLSTARGATRAHAARVTHTHDVSQMLVPASLRALEQRESYSGSCASPSAPFSCALTRPTAAADHCAAATHGCPIAVARRPAAGGSGSWTCKPLHTGEQVEAEVQAALTSRPLRPLLVQRYCKAAGDAPWCAATAASPSALCPLLIPAFPHPTAGSCGVAGVWAGSRAGRRALAALRCLPGPRPAPTGVASTCGSCATPGSPSSAQGCAACRRARGGEGAVALAHTLALTYTHSLPRRTRRRRGPAGRTCPTAACASCRRGRCWRLAARAAPSCTPSTGRLVQGAAPTPLPTSPASAAWRCRRSHCARWPSTSFAQTPGPGTCSRSSAWSGAGPALPPLPPPRLRRGPRPSCSAEPSARSRHAQGPPAPAPEAPSAAPSVMTTPGVRTAQTAQMG